MIVLILCALLLIPGAVSGQTIQDFFTRSGQTDSFAAPLIVFGNDHGGAILGELRPHKNTWAITTWTGTPAGFLPGSCSDKSRSLKDDHDRGSPEARVWIPPYESKEC